MQVQSRLRKLLNRNFMLVDLFQHPTIGSFAEFLADENGDEASFAEVHERVKKQKEAMGKIDSLAQ